MERKIQQRYFLENLKKFAMEKFKMTEDDRGLPMRIANESGFSYSTVQQWFSRSLPRGENLQKISDFFGRTIDEMLGRPIPPSELKIYVDVLTEEDKKILEEKVGPLQNNFSYVPIAEEKDSAEPPEIVRRQPSEVLLIPNAWVKGQKDITAVKAKGKSMEPTIFDGTIVVIDHSETNVDFLNGKIVAIRKNNHVCIKRLQVVSEGTVLAVSDNPDYINETLVYRNAKNEIPIIGKAIWWCTKQE